MPARPFPEPGNAEECVIFCGQLWRWTGGKSASWYFLTIDGAAAEQIAGHALMRRLELGQARGFGSVRVIARIGGSVLRTSLFPKGKDGWMLPVKAAIRKAENLAEADPVTCELTLL